MRTGQETTNLHGAGTPAMAASAPTKPFCAPCGTTILYQDADDAVTCQSCGKPWLPPPILPPTPAEIRAEVLAELTELARPAIDTFWRRFVMVTDTAHILRLGWRQFGGHRKRLGIEIYRMLPPGEDAKRQNFLLIEDAKRLIADVVNEGGEDAA